jgi:hypothetical protein
MLARPELVDVDFAALTFKEHLNAIWAGVLAEELGWGRFDLDPTHTVVTMWARREDGTKDHYFIRLGAEYYDRWPPRVAFVDPQTWQPVKAACRWWPQIQCPTWLGLHLSHPLIEDQGQLICFSFTAEYYMVDHSPTEDAVWKQGIHTISGTLARLQEALMPPYYQKPSA